MGKIWFTPKHIGEMSFYCVCLINGKLHMNPNANSTCVGKIKITLDDSRLSYI